MKPKIDRGDVKKLARELIRQIQSLSGDTTLKNDGGSLKTRLTAPQFQRLEPGLNHLERALTDLGRSGSLYIRRLSAGRGARSARAE